MAITWLPNDGSGGWPSASSGPSAKAGGTPSPSGTSAGFSSPPTLTQVNAGYGYNQIIAEVRRQQNLYGSSDGAPSYVNAGDSQSIISARQKIDNLYTFVKAAPYSWMNTMAAGTSAKLIDLYQLRNALDTLAAPSVTITSISPGSGYGYGGYTLTIIGSGFQNSPSVPTVTIGGKTATNVAWVNSGILTCTAPTHHSGVAALDVTVTNADGSTGTKTNAFTYNAYQINWSSTALLHRVENPKDNVTSSYSQSAPQIEANWSAAFNPLVYYRYRTLVSFVIPAGVPAPSNMTFKLLNFTYLTTGDTLNVRRLSDNSAVDMSSFDLIPS